MHCPRCKGLMVLDPYVDLWDHRRRSPVLVWRCITCGEMLDPVIASNRASPPSVREAYARTKRVAL